VDVEPADDQDARQFVMPAMLLREPGHLDRLLPRFWRVAGHRPSTRIFVRRRLNQTGLPPGLDLPGAYFEAGFPTDFGGELSIRFASCPDQFT
jgi:hypothetical protein